MKINSNRRVSRNTTPPKNKGGQRGQRGRGKVPGNFIKVPRKSAVKVSKKVVKVPVKSAVKVSKKVVKVPVKPAVKVSKRVVKATGKLAHKIAKKVVKVRRKRAIKFRGKDAKVRVKTVVKVSNKRRYKKSSRSPSRSHKRRKTPSRTRRLGRDPNGAPRGLCESTKQWLTLTYGEEGFNQRYNEFFTDDVTILNDSKGIDGPVHELFRAGVVQGKPAFTAVIEDGRVWEKNGAVITPDNLLLGDVSWDYHSWMVYGKDHNVFHKWHEPPLTRINETTGLLTFIWSGNYFHWLFDVLPRVHLLRLSGIAIEKYIVPRDNQGIQDETLNMLGIPKERRIEADHDFHAKVDRLVVPSFVRSVKDHPSEYPLWAAEFLRNEFLLTRDVPVSSMYERIYISRANAWQRRILNEEQVREIMSARGFHILTLEGLPFMEQVRIFASAKIVVAPHGAGLGNLVFCNPGTKVIEMFSPSYVSNYFWHLCNQIHLEHYYLLGETFVKPHEAWWEGSADFDVDTGKLEMLLQIAGI